MCLGANTLKGILQVESAPTFRYVKTSLGSGKQSAYGTPKKVEVDINFLKHSWHMPGGKRGYR